jgi:CBS domain-containing protein
MGRTRATRTAATIGKGVAVLLALVGLRYGDILAIVVAAFIYLGADREAGMVLLDETLGRLRVRDVLPPRPPVAIPDHLTAGDAAERLLAARAPALAVLGHDGAVVGSITAELVARVSPTLRLDQLISRIPPVSADDDLRPTLRALDAARADSIAVVDGVTRALVGVLLRRDVERQARLRELVPIRT